MAGIEDKPASKVVSNNSANPENTNAIALDNLLSDDKKVDERVNNDGVNVATDSSKF